MLIDDLKAQILVLNQKLALAANLETAALLPFVPPHSKKRKKRKGVRHGDAVLTSAPSPVGQAISVVRDVSEEIVSNDVCQPARDILQPCDVAGDGKSNPFLSEGDLVGVPFIELGPGFEPAGLLSSTLASNLVIANSCSSSASSPFLVTETVANALLKNRSGHSKPKRIIPRWKNQISSYNLSQEKLTCQAWDSFTKGCRHRKGGIGFPACNLASESTKAFLVCDSVVNQIRQRTFQG